MFGSKKDERAGKEAAGAAEVQRLTSLPPAALAVELLPAFGSGGARSKGRAGTPPMQVVQWLVTGYPYHPDLRPLVSAVLAGLQVLEHAGLVEMRTAGSGTGGQRYLLTDAGAAALRDGTARESVAASKNPG
ncbi:MAG TPA: hypothetical protein VGD91_07860 [Trebonia sp.]